MIRRRHLGDGVGFEPGRWVAGVLLATVLASGCSGSDTELVEPGDGGSTAATFCDDANAFVTSTPVFFVTQPDADLFGSFDTALASLGSGSPAELRDDLAQLRDGFAHIGASYASVGYDPAAPLTLDGEIQAATRAATDRVESYLRANCGLDDVRERQIDDIMLAFGMDDRSTAECIHVQMGNVANIEPSDLTPEIMTRDVCGTSIINLLSGT